LPELEEADYPQPPAQEHAHAAHGADDDDLPY
jgi:hypothetical protein